MKPAGIRILAHPIMILSPSEIRFIARCREAERQWAVWRWVSLIIGVVVWPASGYILYRLATDEHVAPCAFIALQEDCFWIMNVTCAWLVMGTVARWRGDLRTTLLLKLLEAQGGGAVQSGTSPKGGTAGPGASSGLDGAPPTVR